MRQVLAGIRRRHGTRQEGKEAAVTADVRAMVGTLDDSLAGRRDRALLLLGFAGAFRRSELVALDVADVVRTRDGLVVQVHRSKTDQEGAGRQIGIPYGSTPATCPVRALEDWLAVTGIAGGPLFLQERQRARRASVSGSDRHRWRPSVSPDRPAWECAAVTPHRSIGGPGG